MVAYDNGLTAVQALNNGQVDAVVIDNAPAKEYVAANPGLAILDTSYAEEDYAIGMAKGSSLEAAVNAALEELKADAPCRPSWTSTSPLNKPGRTSYHGEAPPLGHLPFFGKIRLQNSNKKRKARMRMAAQYELLKELLNSGTKLNFGQEFFFKFYQAFLLKDRWLQYVGGVGTTLLVTALALALGIVLGSVVALVRVAHDQQRPGHKNPVLGFFNVICEIYTTIIRGTPMMVQLLIMSMVIFANSRNFTMVGALTLGINSGAYVSEIIRGGLMAVDPGQMEAGRSLGLNYMTTMVVIIIPQAIRAVLPALGNEFIMLLKDTSLITVIGGKELLYAAQGIMNRTYEAMYPLLGVALIYLVLVMLFTRLLAKFERRLAQSDR